MRDILRNPLFVAISIGHMMVDILNSAIPVILATLAIQLGLRNEQLGLAALTYSFGGSLTQPLFGYVADRWGSRWLAAGGLWWMAGFYLVAAWLSPSVAFVVLLLVGLGSAAYHPQATMNARLASGRMAASGTSLFFLFGQLGLAAGPLLAGILLEQVGLSLTLLALGVPGLLVGAWTWRIVVPRHTHTTTATRQKAAASSALRLAWPVMAAFVLLLVFRMWPQAATQTFLPKLMGDAGIPPDRYGFTLSFLMAGAAVGGVLGGYLADRWSAKWTMVFSLALSALPLWAYLQLPLTHPLVPLLVGVAGVLLGASHSILVLMAQSMLPNRMALASGLVLGFMFSAGSAGGYLTGRLADVVGLHTAMEWLAVVALAGALCALFIPRRRELEQAAERPLVVEKR
nr:MFS transporter [Ardenticatena sp.]